MATIISLTAIPPRFPDLGPVLRALLDQSRPAAAVELQIPRAYRRFPDWDGRLPAVPEGVTIRRSDIDHGPATKLLPALAAHAGEEVEILFCDDDRIHDRDWHARFLAARAEHPDACLVEAGHFIPDMDPADTLGGPRAVPLRKTAGYRLRRLVSLGRHKPPRFVESGHVDVLCGYGGVMVRPAFFDAAVFDIPPALWTVDDYWLSGMLARRGVPIWLTAGRTAARSAAEGRAALLDFTHEGAGRDAANAACIRHMRTAWGIWPARG